MKTIYDRKAIRVPDIQVTPAVVPVRETVGYMPVLGLFGEVKTKASGAVVREIDGRHDKHNCHSWSEVYLDNIRIQGNLLVDARQGRGPVRPPMFR